MTTQEMERIAMEQSAEDIGCQSDDFLGSENIVVPFRLGDGARKYLREPITASFVSYGHNVVAAAAEDVLDLASEYVHRFSWYRVFETPAMHWLAERLSPMGYAVCFMAEYFLPGAAQIHPAPCSYPLQVLGSSDFQDLYVPAWSNALCKDRKHLDVLGVGALHEGKLVGLAACSADCDNMWQIGVDVLPTYRKKGIAASCTSTLAREITRRGKVPFYCCAWSNIPSVRNAIRSSFRPAWVELTVKPASVVDSLNRHPERGD